MFTPKMISERTDKNGTRIQTWTKACPKCGGSGYIYYYGHVQGGVCFKCNGVGHEGPKTELKFITTPEYQAKLDARKEAKRVANIPTVNAKRIADLGMNVDGKVFCLIGNTFDIKEQLKTEGAKFNIMFGWHFLTANTLCHYGRPTFEVDVTDIATYNEFGYIMPKEDACEIVNGMRKANAPKVESTSQFIGTVGQKIEVQVKFLTAFEFTNRFGTGYFNKLEDANGNQFTWKTGKNLGWHDVVNGNNVDYVERAANEFFTIKGTIDAHEEYKGVKVTYLTRCKVID